MLGLPKLSVDPVLFLPLWLGTLRDHSGHGNHGALNTGYWQQSGALDGVRPIAPYAIMIDDSPSMRLTKGTILVSSQRLVQSIKAITVIFQNGINMPLFYLTATAAQFAVYGSFGTRFAINPYDGATLLAMTFKSGEVPECSVDAGTPVAFSGSITADGGAGLQTSLLNHLGQFRVFDSPGVTIALYPEILPQSEIALFHNYSQSLITPRKQWPGGGLRYPGRGDPYTPATGDPMWVDNLQTARVTLANQTSGYLSNTPALIVTGTWALREDDIGRYYYCVSAGKLRVRLLGADGFTTKLFVESGGVTLTKDSTGFDLDFGTGDIVRAVQLTAP